MSNRYSSYSNEQLVKERDHAAKQEALLAGSRHMHTIKRGCARRSTEVANELCSRMIAGTLTFDDNGDVA